MMKICVTLAFVCLFALQEVASDGPACRNFNRKQVIEAANVAIQTCDEVLNLYNEIIEHFFESDDVIQKTASGIGELKTHLTNGVDLYEKSPKPVSDWCVQTTPILTTYKAGASIQKDILLKSLTDIKTIVNTVHDGLTNSKKSINIAGRNLFALERYLAEQFDENAKYIMDAQREAVKTQVPQLKKKVATIREFLEDFACTQDRVTIAHIEIGELKSVSETAKAFVVNDYLPEIHDSAIESVNSVVEKCNNYRKKYE